MTESSLPTPPATGDATAPAYDATTPARRTWRDRLPRRLPSGRRAVAAGAVVAGLAVGGAGFGVGYAVGDDGATDTATTRTGPGWGERGDGRGPMGDLDGDGQVPGGEMGGEMGGQPGGPPGDLTQGQGGTTDQAPDFDGDGQPDTDSGTDGSDSDTTSLSS
ncbi:hypothetical protein NYO98_18225 [Nocardioides sp. STR2]|uniref:Uncharacterized protein n=1 Tax=Nocardioides pini TaxID=2975053 RepID=A0ABT4CGY7_9ACTN|nr:hypothetical protein [Nocardioides pini]MCY4728222.1 hypothetical protein [Nocardioides pini]